MLPRFGGEFFEFFCRRKGHGLMLRDHSSRFLLKSIKREFDPVGRSDSAPSDFCRYGPAESFLWVSCYGCTTAFPVGF
jgi:hypothetical protein